MDVGVNVDGVGGLRLQRYSEVLWEVEVGAILALDGKEPITFKSAAATQRCQSQGCHYCTEQLQLQDKHTALEGRQCEE